MALAKLKHQTENRLEDLADRIASEISQRAAKMTPAKRTQADSETKKIADRAQRRTH
jgi:hypothetical protein